MIVQLLAILAVVGAFGAGMLTMTGQQESRQKDLNTRVTAMVLRQSFVNALANPTAWKHTRAANEAMDCAAAKKDARPHCRSTSESQRVGVELRNSLNEIILRKGDADGFTASGEPCAAFAPPPNGNPACPFRFRLFWRTDCAGKCLDGLDAEEFVHISFEHSPGPGVTLFNPLNYELADSNRLAYMTMGSPALRCADRGLIFVGAGKRINAQAADAQGCIRPQAFWGPRGPLGPKGDAGPPGPQGPVGPQGVDLCPRDPTP